MRRCRVDAREPRAQLADRIQVSVRPGIRDCYSKPLRGPNTSSNADHGARAGAARKHKRAVDVEEDRAITTVPVFLPHHPRSSGRGDYMPGSGAPAL